MINLLKSFYLQVQNTPEKAALVDQGGKRSTSYRELADISARLASWLLQQGIGREKLVAIRVPRGAAFFFRAQGEQEHLISKPLSDFPDHMRYPAGAGHHFAAKIGSPFGYVRFR